MNDAEMNVVRDDAKRLVGKLMSCQHAGQTGVLVALRNAIDSRRQVASYGFVFPLIHDTNMNHAQDVALFVAACFARFRCHEPGGGIGCSMRKYAAVSNLTGSTRASLERVFSYDRKRLCKQLPGLMKRMHGAGVKFDFVRLYEDIYYWCPGRARAWATAFYNGPRKQTRGGSA